MAPLSSRPVSPRRRAHPLPHLLGDLLPYSAAVCSQLTQPKKGESASLAASVSVRFCFFCWPVCLLVPVYLLVNLSFHLSSCLSFFRSSSLSPLKECAIFLSSHLYYPPSLVSSFGSLITKVSFGPNSPSCLCCSLSVSLFLAQSYHRPRLLYPCTISDRLRPSLLPRQAAGCFFWTGGTRAELFVQSMAICSYP